MTTNNELSNKQLDVVDRIVAKAAAVRGLTTSGNVGKLTDVAIKDGHKVGKSGTRTVVVLAVKDLCGLLGKHERPRCGKCKRIRGLLRGGLAGNDSQYTHWQFDAKSPSTEALMVRLAELLADK
jgi:hypothetical protein